jgi:hypothetical protein
MANGEQMTPGRLIIAVVVISMSINGLGVTLTNNAISKQSRDIEKLRDMVYEQMDDRYRRAEAIEAHNNLKESIDATKSQDARIESKIDSHLRERN